MQNVSIEQLIGHGHFFSHTFLDADGFVRYCKQRNLDTSLEKLERLERLGIFLPLMRIRWPKIKIKVEHKDNGEGYDELGMLQPDEQWDGEIVERNGWFDWSDRDTIQWLVSGGYLWKPSQEQFQSWADYKDADGRLSVYSYYSIFQTLPLHSYLQSTTIRLSFDQIAGWSTEQAMERFEIWKKQAESMISFRQTREDAFGFAARLCQVLASRYWPYAKSDGSTITIPDPSRFDWNKFRREWNAQNFLSIIGLTIKEIAECWQNVSSQVAFFDPLDGWQDFVGFIKPNKKERLKGDALLAQTWRIMETILDLLCEEVSAKRLYRLDSTPEDKEAFYGKDVPKNDLKYIEFLANEYGVNPRPKLILVVEGHGEEDQIPRLAEELIPPSFPKLRIYPMNIKGVGEFKKIERLIDHYHSLQTIVFVILDNENNAVTRKKSLCESPSIWSPQRTVTKEEYVYLWEKNVEFDNFSDEEIALGMTEICEKRYVFSCEEIAICRQEHGRKDPLCKLYKEKLNYGLNKRSLLKILFDYAIARPEIETNATKRRRPIVDVVLKIQRLALTNYQPSHLDAWQETQNSDWLGNIRETKSNEDL